MTLKIQDNELIDTGTDTPIVKGTNEKLMSFKQFFESGGSFADHFPSFFSSLGSFDVSNTEQITEES